MSAYVNPDITELGDSRPSFLLMGVNMAPLVGFLIKYDTMSIHIVGYKLQVPNVLLGLDGIGTSD